MGDRIEKYIYNEQTTRNRGVDTVRVIAIFFVIAIHTYPFKNTPLHFDVVVNQISRFAVPFFFMVSGFFWHSRALTSGGVIKYSANNILRLFTIFAFWSIAYILYRLFISSMHSEAPMQLAALFPKDKAIINILFEGGRVHLWFLMSLITVTAITAIFVHFGQLAALTGFSIVLFFAGLLGKPYAGSPLGIESSFDFRNGPFFGLACFVTGALLNRRGLDGKLLRAGALITATGILLHFSELFAIKWIWGGSVIQDFVLGTYFFGVGIGLISFSRIGFLERSALSMLGKYVLGIYVIHFFFIDLFRYLISPAHSSTAIDILMIMFVFFSSALSAILLSTSKLTRRLIM